MGWNHQLDIPFRKLARNPQKSIVCKGVSRCQKEENFQLPFVGIFSPSHEWNLLKLKTTKCQPQELWWLFFDEGWYPIIWGYIWDLLWKITSEKHLSNNKKITNQIQGTKSPGVFFFWKKSMAKTCSAGSPARPLVVHSGPGEMSMIPNSEWIWLRIHRAWVLRPNLSLCEQARKKWFEGRKEIDIEATVSMANANS